MKHPNTYSIDVTINGNKIKKVLIGRHYELKHAHYMNDELILSLVKMLDGKIFQVDSTTRGIEYYVADIEYGAPLKVYRLIWLFEGKILEVIGIINAYRRRRKEK
ncbi:MAG: hypothetical protein V1647_00360 [Pseudomonadota bacterium]